MPYMTKQQADEIYDACPKDEDGGVDVFAFEAERKRRRIPPAAPRQLQPLRESNLPALAFGCMIGGSCAALTLLLALFFGR
jgi:hypothetical protein